MHSIIRIVGVIWLMVGMALFVAILHANADKRPHQVAIAASSPASIK